MKNGVLHLMHSLYLSFILLFLIQKDYNKKSIKQEARVRRRTVVWPLSTYGTMEGKDPESVVTFALMRTQQLLVWIVKLEMSF